MKLLYSTKVTALGGRTGTVSTEDGAFRIALATPKELGGPGGEGANPEQLFAAGYAACLLGALKFVAGRRKVRLAEQSKVTATVGIGMRDGGEGFALDVALSAELPGIEASIARELLAEADAVCPYSHLARNGLAVRLSLAD